MLLLAGLGWLCAGEPKSLGKLIQSWTWVSVKEQDDLSSWGNGKGLVTPLWRTQCHRDGSENSTESVHYSTTG